MLPPKIISACVTQEERGMKTNSVEAHKWLNVAASAGFQDARNNREMVEKRLIPAQLAEAQEAVRV
jgi:hypothetical protein